MDGLGDGGKWFSIRCGVGVGKERKENRESQRIGCVIGAVFDREDGTGLVLR